MLEIEKAAAGAISKGAEYGLSVTILMLAVLGLGYLHHVCRRENAENRKEFTGAIKESTDKQNETNLKMNESLNNLSNVVAVLTEVVRSK